jgi:hypothetical protein
LSLCPSPPQTLPLQFRQKQHAIIHTQR